MSMLRRPRGSWTSGSKHCHGVGVGMCRMVFSFHWFTVQNSQLQRWGLQIKFHYFHIFQYYHNSDSLQVLRKVTPKGYSFDAVLMETKALKGKIIESYGSRGST